MSRDIHSQSTDMLFDAVCALKNREECYRFFSDVCTPREIEAISQRFEVADMLLNGHTYQEIVRQTGVSTATISRVNRSLEDSNGFYETVFSRIKTENPGED